MNEHDTLVEKAEEFNDDGGGMFGSMEGVAKKAKDPKKTIKQLINYLAPQRVAISIVMLMAVVSTVFAVIGPRVMGRVTTILVDGVVAHMFGTGLLTDFRQMGRLTGILIALYVVSAVCNFFQEWYMSRIAVKVTQKLREEIADKMHRLPINYYDTRSQGEVMSRMTNDVDLVSQTLSMNITQLISSVTTVLGTLIMMLTISVTMTAAALVVIPISMWIMVVVLNKSHVFFSEQQKSLGKLNGIVEETYSSHNVVRAYNGEDDALGKFQTANTEVRSSGWKAQFMGNIVEPIFGFVGNLGYVLVAVMGGWLVIRRAITIGDVQAFIQYIQNFTQPLGELGSAGNMLQGTIAAAERVFEFLNEEEEVPDPQISAQKEKYEGHVSFQNVKFGYNPDKIILHDFSKEVKPG
jgi:ATP-binding cassette subfamily B protein